MQKFANNCLTFRIICKAVKQFYKCPYFNDAILLVNRLVTKLKGDWKCAENWFQKWPRRQAEVWATHYMAFTGRSFSVIYFQYFPVAIPQEEKLYLCPKVDKHESH